MRELRITWPDPRPGVVGVTTLPGAEALRRIKDGTLPPPPLAVLLGFDIDEVGEGRTVFSLTPAEQHTNLTGAVHGGVPATLLDTALGCAVQTLLEPGHVPVTTGLFVQYARPVPQGAGRLVVEGRVAHRGRTTAMAAGEVRDEAGRLLVSASGAFQILDLRNRAARDEAVA